MNEPVYTIEFDSISNQYFFESVGQKGSIFKIVIFTEVQNNVFNLGFGDYDLKPNKLTILRFLIMVICPEFLQRL